jgi:tRNA(Arg) A34 adenosine deaminase TadA
MSRAAQPEELAKMNWDLGGAEFGDVMLRLPDEVIARGRETPEEASDGLE